MIPLTPDQQTLYDAVQAATAADDTQKAMWLAHDAPADDRAAVVDQLSNEVTIHLIARQR